MEPLNTAEQTSSASQTNNLIPGKRTKRLPIIISLISLMFVIVGSIVAIIFHNKSVSQRQQSSVNGKVTSTAIAQQKILSQITKPIAASSALVNSINSFYDEILKALTKELKDWDTNFIITDFDITVADTYEQAVGSEAQANKYSYAMIKVFSKRLQIIRYYYYSYGYIRGLKQNGQDETQQLLLEKVNDWDDTMSKPQYPPGNAIKVHEEKKDPNIKYYLHSCHYYRSDLIPHKTYWNCRFVDEKEAKTEDYLYLGNAYESIIDASTNQFERWLKVNKIPEVGGQ